MNSADNHVKIHHYHNDAIANFRRTTELLREGPANAQATLDAVMYFSFGAERFLKAILHAVNPVLVLESENIVNAIHVLYGSRLISQRPKKNDIDPKELNRKSITYTSALFRAAMFSPVAAQHIGLFTELGTYRNIIAHGDMSALDLDKVSRFLNAHFYPAAIAIAAELNTDAAIAFGHEFELLQGESDRQLQMMNTAKRIEKLLDDHKKKWNEIWGNPVIVDAAKRATQHWFHATLFEGTDRLMFPCPACKQPAIVTIEEESGTSLSLSSGFEIVDLVCHYCDLKIEDQMQMDYLQIYALLSTIEYSYEAPEPPVLQTGLSQ